jgi:hypothetical protein
MEPARGFGPEVREAAPHLIHEMSAWVLPARQALQILANPIQQVIR